MTEKQQRQQDILEKTRAQMGMTKTQFAAELGMTKQTYATYTRLANPSMPELEGLLASAVLYRGMWIGDLCNKLIVGRGAQLPCVCETEIGDNGVCPKHGTPPQIEKQNLEMGASVKAVAA